MRLSKNVQATLLSGAIGAMFALGMNAAACVMPSQRPPAESVTPSLAVVGPPGAGLVVGYAREHPDPAVNGPFADKLESGEIKIVAKKPKGDKLATFGPSGDGYSLTIDPDLLKPKPTRSEFEDALSVLSHEHAHYLQFIEGQMTNYHPAGKPMTETRCTLVILVEIDAHGKSCRDARRYGWTSRQAVGACERTPATIAEFIYKDRSDAYPVCKDVWAFFAGKSKWSGNSKRKMRSLAEARPRNAPVYLPPP
ncbi:MAG: hypothetical protein AAB554_04770 [Patescibacteria group bacterium]